MGGVMSKNARNVRRQKRQHRLRFSPYYGAQLGDLITMLSPSETPFMALIPMLIRRGAL